MLGGLNFVPQCGHCAESRFTGFLQALHKTGRSEPESGIAGCCALFTTARLTALSASMIPAATMKSVPTIATMPA